ncbi:MAG: large subunit ribosomal protein L6 [Hyphomicrobiaceae bacterium]|jgi:large subunit ribosomal protein L6
MPVVRSSARFGSVSRLGKIPVVIPNGVTVSIDGDVVSAKGPKGQLATTVSGGITVKQEDGQLLVERPSDAREARARQGLVRRLVANVVEGVDSGFSKTLEITGVGYRADAQGAELHLQLGYSHPIVYMLPDGVVAKVDKQTTVTFSGPDRQLVGEVAASVRKLRPPEPYKGKGIRYSDETIRRKSGKSRAA